MFFQECIHSLRMCFEKAVVYDGNTGHKTAFFSIRLQAVPYLGHIHDDRESVILGNRSGHEGLGQQADGRCIL